MTVQDELTRTRAGASKIDGLDRLEVKDLLLRCIIGINEDERRNKQDVLINLVLFTDIRQAAASDDIASTANYRTVTKQVIEHVESSHYYLVETLAERVAEICLRDPHVLQVQVSIEKPGALRFARSVGVRIEREREGGNAETFQRSTESAE